MSVVACDGFGDGAGNLPFGELTQPSTMVGFLDVMRWALLNEEVLPRNAPLLKSYIDVAKTNAGINGIRFTKVHRLRGEVRQAVYWQRLWQGEVWLLHSASRTKLANHGRVSREGGKGDGVNAGHVLTHGGATQDVVDHAFATALCRALHI
eukprot:5654557-Amphidinium_carterae.3